MSLTVNWEQIGEILVLLFVISVVFETALTPVFNWRIFARFCEGRGIKTPITIAAAVGLLWNYDIDIFKHVIDAFAGTEGTTAAAQGATAATQGATAAGQGESGSSSTFLGRIMTGLLVAGGSGAIFNLFAKMGLRNPAQLAEKAVASRTAAEKAKATKAQAAAQNPAPPASG